MKMFSENLRNHAKKITNYEQKEIIPLTDDEKKSDAKQKACYIC